MTAAPLQLGSEQVQALAASRRKTLPWVLNLLLLYLAGITIFGKGPTYIGVEPVFWGEIVLLVSLVWALRRWHRVVIRSIGDRALMVLVCCFIAVGAAEASGNYLTWKLDALRDSAVWYYALFYFVGLVIASNRDEASLFASRWKLFFILSVLWGIPELLSKGRLSMLGPILPGSRSALLFGSSGSELVQNVGLGCLLLLNVRSRAASRIPGSIRILLVLAGMVAFSQWGGRGSRISVLLAFIVLLAVNLRQPSSGKRLYRRVGVVVLLGMAGLAGALAYGVDLIPALHLDRLREAVPGQIEGTAEWRSEWWSGIYRAVMEQNPAFGLGFGDPLTEYNPFLQYLDESALVLRSPHNFNVTIFARMGLVGSLLWSGILLLGVFLPLWRAVTPRGPKASGEALHRGFWVAAIVAAWVNASFGVLMEGPVMAIPFWLILGMLSMRPSLNTHSVRHSGELHDRTSNAHNGRLDIAHT